MSKEEILKEFELFSSANGGIESWLSSESPDEIFDRLLTIRNNPISKVQLNQLLVMGHEAPVSDGFFSYYWCHIPEEHIYDVKKDAFFVENFNLESNKIGSLKQLKWGLSRLYTDSLLLSGSIRTGYRALRNKNTAELVEIFKKNRICTDKIKNRGQALSLEKIDESKRFLISEIVQKAYDKDSEKAIERRLTESLKNYKAFKKDETAGASVLTLLNDDFSVDLEDDSKKDEKSSAQLEFDLVARDIFDEIVKSNEDIKNILAPLYIQIEEAWRAAETNTRRFLSMVSDLDVYVATSMRTREDFQNVAKTINNIFTHTDIKDFDFRYFDPTMSVSDGHGNKGLVECLMVKCSKVLIYCSGEKDSYGKAAEAAMALSLGKPVIFLCDKEENEQFFKNVHPLGRLIHFQSGVAVGAIVTSNEDDIPKILSKIFSNKMEYVLEHEGNGFLRLKERITKSTVRLQTNNRMISETFWNHYHG